MGDDVEILNAGQWRMWAVKVDDWREYIEPGHRRYASMYCRKDIGEEVVPVIVTESAHGTYYGWIAKGRDVPTMIHANEGLFRMCFPYGPAAEEERGNGRVVRLTVEPC